MFAFLARALFGAAIYGLWSLWMPKGPVVLSESTGGNFGNILVSLAICSFLAIIGTRNKAAENSPTILGRGLKLVKTACIAVVAGICEIVMEGKAKAEADQKSEVA
jgi:hypothetical protein